MDKSPDAFRTISEVADWLGTPTHVLRFWESRFTQVKPVKRAGGRRYYRPNDMALLGGIKKLLHDDGLTIRGVQKILREQGVKYVAALSQPVDTIEIEEAGFAQDVPTEPPMGQVIEMRPEPTRAQEPEAAVEASPETLSPDMPEQISADEAEPEAAEAPASPDLSTPEESGPEERVAAETAPEAGQDTTDSVPDAAETGVERAPDSTFNPFARPESGSPADAAAAPAPEETREDRPDERPDASPAPETPEPSFIDFLTGTSAPQEPATPEATAPQQSAEPEPTFTRAPVGGPDDEAETDSPSEPMAFQPYDVTHGDAHIGHEPTDADGHGAPVAPSPEVSETEAEAGESASRDAFAARAADAEENAPGSVQAEQPPARPAIPEPAPIPEGPTLSEQVLRRLRTRPTVDREAIAPVYERLAELRARMTGNP